MEITMIISDWQESAEDAITALKGFQCDLEMWKRILEDGGTVDPGDFMAAIQDLADVGLDDWLDGNPLDVDGLAAAFLREGETYGG